MSSQDELAQPERVADETDERLMALLAIMGESNRPNTG
jgi:hypothetical protein